MGRCIVSLKSKVFPWQKGTYPTHPMIKLYVCPECDSTVPQNELIFSYRLVEDRIPICHEVKMLCRKCRDSGI
jgi:hypothetical protein